MQVSAVANVRDLSAVGRNVDCEVSLTILPHYRPFPKPHCQVHRFHATFPRQYQRKGRAMLSIRKLLSGLVVIICTLGCRETASSTPQPASGAVTRIRLAGTPHQDTTMFLWGLKHGTFRKRGLELDIRDTTFNEQIEFAGGGGCDIAMGTVDELASKSKNLNIARRRVVYLMPAWLF